MDKIIKDAENRGLVYLDYKELELKQMLVDEEEAIGLRIASREEKALTSISELLSNSIINLRNQFNSNTLSKIALFEDDRSISEFPLLTPEERLEPWLLKKYTDDFIKILDNLPPIGGIFYMTSYEELRMRQENEWMLRQISDISINKQDWIDRWNQIITIRKTTISQLNINELKNESKDLEILDLQSQTDLITMNEIRMRQFNNTYYKNIKDFINNSIFDEIKNTFKSNDVKLYFNEMHYRTFFSRS